jgi:ABC-2 type transport system permease protein
VSAASAPGPAAPARTAGGSLRAYRSLSRTALRSLLAYQGSFLFGLVATVFSLIAMLYLWRAVLGNGTGSQGFDWPRMKAYLLAAFVAGSLVSAYVDYRMAFRIRQGDVALDLVHPVRYQPARFAEAVGFAGYEFATAMLVAVVTATVFGGVPTPPPASRVPFVVSALLVLPLRFTLVYASGLAVFWTHNYVGVQAGRIALVTLLSGALVPLRFLPGWFQAVAAVLPFAGMASTPALCFAGLLQGADAWRAVGVQAAWTVALWVLARAFWGAASRKLTVHGG